VFDEKAYTRQFQGLDYVEQTNFPVKFIDMGTEKTKRAILINLKLAKQSGIDLTGFESE